jgi:hypothetical protein
MSTILNLVDRQKSISQATKQNFIDEQHLQNYLENYLPQFSEDDQLILGFLLLGILNVPYLDWPLEDDAWVVAKTLLPKDNRESIQLDLIRMWAKELNSNVYGQSISILDEFWGLNGHPFLSIQEFERQHSDSSSGINELLVFGLEFFNSHEGSPKDPRGWHQAIWEARSNFRDKKILKRHEFVVRAIIEQPREQTDPLIAYLVHGQSNNDILSRFGITESQLWSFKTAVHNSIWQFANAEKELNENSPRRGKVANRDVISETEYDPFQRS